MYSTVSPLESITTANSSPLSLSKVLPHTALARWGIIQLVQNIGAHQNQFIARWGISTKTMATAWRGSLVIDVGKIASLTHNQCSTI